MGTGQSGCFTIPKLDADSWALLSLDKDAIPAIIDRVKDELQQAGGFVRSALG